MACAVAQRPNLTSRPQAIDVLLRGLAIVTLKGVPVWVRLVQRTAKALAAHESPAACRCAQSLQQGFAEALAKAWAGPGQHPCAPSAGAEQDTGTDLRPWPWFLDVRRAGCALRRRRTQALRRGG